MKYKEKFEPIMNVYTESIGYYNGKEIIACDNGELYFQEIPEEFVVLGAAVNFMDVDSICILPEEEQREIRRLFGKEIE